MKMLRDNTLEVSKVELHKRLSKQAERLADATPYRRRTVKLAIKVLEMTKDASAFNNKSTALITVKLLLKSENEYRQQDVAKMLYTQYGYSFNELNYSDEFKKLKEERKLECKDATVKFVRVKKSQ